uniref:Uncharacterized protein n=1 Tax=Setaria italica TaxID=4555 RepID=K3YF11_SETIT
MLTIWLKLSSPVLANEQWPSLFWLGRRKESLMKLDLAFASALVSA